MSMPAPDWLAVHHKARATACAESRALSVKAGWGPPCRPYEPPAHTAWNETPTRPLVQEPFGYEFCRSHLQIGHFLCPPVALHVPLVVCVDEFRFGVKQAYGIAPEKESPIRCTG